MSIWDDVTGWLKGAGESVDWGNVLALGGSYMLNQSGANSAQTAPTGYQGSIPTYAAVRSPVEVSVPANYRPGSAGRRYFSDTRYVAPDSAAAEATAAEAQAQGLASINTANPFREARPGPIASSTAPTTSPIVSQAPATVIQQMPVPQQQGLANYTQQYAEGGIARLAKGRYLNGESDGMADQVRANIDGRQEARLSDGEYVIPADVVSHLGNGNSSAGAKVLDQMLSRVRKQRTGNEKQGKEIDPRKVMPS
jgi:hypothetical protein